MADAIDFSGARFSTAYMKPVGDEEVNALWGRKIADNTARAIGTWGTVIMLQRTAFEATARITLDGLGFSTYPSMDWFMLRGGSLPYQPVFTADSPGVILGQMWYHSSTDNEIILWFGGDAYRGTLLNITNYGTWQKDFGTYIYRLRGW